MIILLSAGACVCTRTVCSMLPPVAASLASLTACFCLQTNYLGPYLLTRMLGSTLKRDAPSRVINVTSVTHRYSSAKESASILFLNGLSMPKAYPVSPLPCRTTDIRSHCECCFRWDQSLDEYGSIQCRCLPGLSSR